MNIKEIQFRVDDFPGTKPEEFWRHNLDNFKRFNDVMIKHNIEYVLGVIPKYTTENDIRWLTESQNIEVAMHGIFHDEDRMNEFHSWQTTSDIQTAIESAVQPLNDCNPYKVRKYIPPHNVIDVKTVKALNLLGFTKILGGPGTDKTVFMIAKSLNLSTEYYDSPFEYGRSDELMQINPYKVYSTALFPKICFHWTWEWNIGLQHLDEFLKKIEEF